MNDEEEIITKIIEFTHCTPINAKNALQIANGKLDQAISILLDEKNVKNSFRNQNINHQTTTTTPIQNTRISSNCFYPNYIPSCEINQNSLRISDIVKVNFN